MEKRLLKVLKALAELRDLTLGELLEYIVRCGFAGQEPFSAYEIGQIGSLTSIYGLSLADGHPEPKANDENPAPDPTA